MVDSLHQKCDQDKVRLAAQGYEVGWKMRQQWLSRCYTTRFKDILEVK